MVSLLYKSHTIPYQCSKDMSTKDSRTENAVLYNVMFKEMEVNKEGSEYIVRNYYNILKRLDKEYGSDLLNDLYINLLKAEERGEGYNMAYVEKGFITVEQFIFARIKLYKKNPKYRAAYLNSTKNGSNVVQPCFETEEVPSSFTGDDVTEMNSYQRELSYASVDPEYDLMDRKYAKEDLEYCLDFEPNIEIPLVGFLIHIDEITEKKVDPSIFTRLRETLEYHNEFKDSLLRLLVYRTKHRLEFEELLRHYK